MKKIFFIAAALFFSLLAASKDYEVYGPQGGISLKVELPSGSVIKEACDGGKFFNAKFDPANPPEFVKVWGMYKLGREYLTSTQDLDIFGTAGFYVGPVRIIHGTRDSIVPMWCSEKYLQTYGDKAELIRVEGENHTITRHRREVTGLVVEFFSTGLMSL